MKIRFEDAFTTAGYGGPIKMLKIKPGDMRLEALIEQLQTLRDKLGPDNSAHVVYEVDHDPDGGARAALSIIWPIDLQAVTPN